MSHPVVLDLLAQLRNWDDAADPQPLVAVLADALGDLCHPKQVDVRDLRIVATGQTRQVWIGSWNHFAQDLSEREARARLRAYLFGMLTLPCPECRDRSERSLRARSCSECHGRRYKLRPTDDF
jgi:hypothetical protein